VECPTSERLEIYDYYLEDGEEIPKRSEENIGCVKCGKCCRPFKKHAIYLNIIDVLKIKIKTGLKFGEFVENNSWLGWVVRTVNDEHGTYCMFLRHEDDGTKSCGIHGFYMPSVCSAYPGNHYCFNRRFKEGSAISRYVSELSFLF
jgi:Fe-S-cluster containining protein